MWCAHCMWGAWSAGVKIGVNDTEVLCVGSVWLIHLFGTWEGHILMLYTHAAEISDVGTYVGHVYTGYIWYVFPVCAGL